MYDLYWNFTHTHTHTHQKKKHVCNIKVQSDTKRRLISPSLLIGRRADFLVSG